MGVILDPRGRTELAECVGGPYDGDALRVRATGAEMAHIVGRPTGRAYVAGRYVLADGWTPREGHKWVYRWHPEPAD